MLDVKQNLTDLGVDIVGGTAEQFAAVKRNDTEKWMHLSNTKTL
jgi:hypothetical protein